MVEKTVHRLDKIRKHYGLNISAFEEKIGYANNGFSHAIKNNSSIKDEIIRNTLESFPEVSMRWLVTGHGEMHSNESLNIKNCVEFLTDNIDQAIEDKDFLRMIDAGIEKP